MRRPAGTARLKRRTSPHILAVNLRNVHIYLLQVYQNEIILQTAAFIDETKTKTRQALSEAQRENEAQLQAAKLRHPKQFGLPDNQRIIDPRKGPVKKVAAVRKLPKLDSGGSGGSGSSGNSPRHS